MFNQKIVPYTGDEERARRVLTLAVVAIMFIGAIFGAFVTTCVTSCNNSTSETVEVYRVEFEKGMNIRVQPTTNSQSVGSLKYGDFIIAEKIVQHDDGSS